MNIINYPVELVFAMTDEILNHQFDNNYLIQKRVLLQRVWTRLR